MNAPPPRPPRWEERLADRALVRIAPRLPRIDIPPPPDALTPWEALTLAREGGGSLAATWYPPLAELRGVVLLAPPWLPVGQAYFHRRGRIEALRAAGYAALSFDLGGFGASAPTRGFRDRDVEAALAEARRRAGGKPVHAWGVSSGGYWLHPALARGKGVHGFVLEDVSPHLLEWSGHTSPRHRAIFETLRRAFPRTNAYMDMRLHAPHVRHRGALYVQGGRDPGIPVEDARELAKRAEGDLLVVDGAAHLEAIKRRGPDVIARALSTLERAESAGPRRLSREG